MKYYLKISLLSILTILLLLFILFVDTTFYHVPSFIKIYRIEREIIIIIAFLFLFYEIKSVSNRWSLNLKQTLTTIACALLTLFLLITIPQLVFKKYLILWDNNPFLAEYPLFWNIVSTFCAMITVAILLFILLSVKKLLRDSPSKFSDFEFRLLIGLLVIFGIVFNFLEDRYAFERISLIQLGLSTPVLIFGVPLLIITLVISYSRFWLDRLNQREKYIGFSLTVIIFPVSVYLMGSNLMLPVYSFSTTLKGFVLATMLFVNIYMAAAFLGLLFRLPTARLYDRASREILSISKISKMISMNENIEQVLNFIVECACSLTASDACWLVFQSCDTAQSRIMASINLTESERVMLEKPAAGCLENWVRENRQSILVHNINEDERILPLRSLPINWKSVMAIPLIYRDTVVGILCSVRKSSYAYDDKALNTLKSFAVQTNIALSRTEIASYVGIEQVLSDINNADNLTVVRHNQLQMEVLHVKHCYFDIIPISEYNQSVVISYPVHISSVKKSEFRGALKTLFMLEPDPQTAYRKIVDIMLPEFSENDDLPLFYYSDDTKELVICSRRPLKVISIFPVRNRKSRRDLQELLAVTDIYCLRVPVNRGVWLMLADENFTIAEDVSVIADKIIQVAGTGGIAGLIQKIPETLQQELHGSGIGNLILFRKSE